MEKENTSVTDEGASLNTTASNKDNTIESSVTDEGASLNTASNEDNTIGSSVTDEGASLNTASKEDNTALTSSVTDQGASLDTASNEDNTVPASSVTDEGASLDTVSNAEDNPLGSSATDEGASLATASNAEDNTAFASSVTDEGASVDTACTSNAETLPASSSSDSAIAKKYYRRPITLYHYTSTKGKEGIERDRKVKERPSTEHQRHERHGQGVNFTSLDHGTELCALIKNNFINFGNPLKRKGISFYHRMQYVVRIEFDENDRIEKITDHGRDLFVHRGDIDLRNYEGRYSIYRNPNAPSDFRRNNTGKLRTSTYRSHVDDYGMYGNGDSDSDIESDDYDMYGNGDSDSDIESDDYCDDYCDNELW